VSSNNCLTPAAQNLESRWLGKLILHKRHAPQDRQQPAQPCLNPLSEFERDIPPTHRCERRHRLSGKPHRHVIFLECARTRQ
jgi:hypothetical protein